MRICSYPYSDEEPTITTERQWLIELDPLRIVGQCLSAMNLRKYRLFACGCYRELLFWLADEKLEAVKVAENCADGASGRLHRAFSYGYQSDPEGQTLADVMAVSVPGPFMIESVVRVVERRHDQVSSGAIDRNRYIQIGHERRKRQAIILRDLIGNPFRTVTIDPRWLTSTVLDLTRNIYDERDFEKMPILADALMDAGCDSEEIINHCRGEGPHVRGCWVVDIVCTVVLHRQHRPRKASARSLACAAGSYAISLSVGSRRSLP